MMGIYCYVDTMDNSVVYVGKDSHIDKNKRHIEHNAPSVYNKQPINRVLQNNKGRYKYQVLANDVETKKELNTLEMQYIVLFNPKFNFTTGGDGGYTLSEETRKKVSENNSRYWLGKKRPKETGKKVGDALRKNYPTITKAGFNYGKQNYVLRYNGKRIANSIFKEKLEKRAEEINKGVI